MRTIARWMLVVLSLTLCSYSVAPGQLTEQLRSMSERRKADDMLKRARTAMQDRNLALAEWYLDRIDKMEVKFDSVFGRMADTPDRLRAEIAQLKANDRLTDALDEEEVASRSQTIPDLDRSERFVPSVNPPTNLVTPPKPGVGGAPAETQVAESPKARARRMLAKSWSALSSGDIAAAAGWYQNAVACDAQFAEGEFSPEHLAAEFAKRKIDLGKALAALSPTATSSEVVQASATEALEDAPSLQNPAALAVIPRPQEEAEDDNAPSEIRDPALLEADQITSSRLLQRGAKILSPSGATPVAAQLSEKRTEVVALLAQAQAAMQRDDLAVAARLVQQADALQVPDSAYEVGDVRPWMLKMELDKLSRRFGQSDTDSVAQQGVFSPPPIEPRLPVVEMVGAASPPATNQVSPTAVAQADFNQPYAMPGANTPVPNAYYAPNAVAPNAGYPAQYGPPQFGPPPGGYAAHAPPGTQVAPVSPRQTASRPEIAGLVYDPVDDVTHNAVASGQQELPTPQTSSESLTPPYAATPFPIEAPTASLADPNGFADDARTIPEPSVPQDSNGDGLPVPPQGPSVEPTLAEPTPAAETRRRPPVVNNEPAEDDPPTYAPTAEGDSPAYELFNQGQEALVDQDFRKALRFFREAWQFEADLDPETRQALQDNLQIARSQAAFDTAANPVTGPTREVDPVQLSPTPEEQRAAEQFINEISRQQATVRALRQSNPTKAWDELKKMRESLAKAELDDRTREQLLVRVDRQIDELEQYVETNRSRLENDARNQRVLEEMDRRRAMKARNQQQLAELVDEFNQLWDQQRFSEANIIAKKARELDPMNPVVQTLMMKATTARQIQSKLMRDQRFNENAMAAWHNVEMSGTPMENEDGVDFPHYWKDLTKKRKRQLANEGRRFTEVEQEIRRALQKKVDVKFENMPLAAVIDKLAKMAGINAFLDPEGLTAEGVSSDTSVNISLRKPVSLKSALNLILEPMHLSYVIQDEVLRITSEQVRDGDVYPQVYPVADLVIPVPDFYPSNNVGLTGAIRQAYENLNMSHTAGGFSTGALMQGPLTIMQNELEHPANASQSVLAQMSAGGLIPQTPGPGGTARLPGAAGGGAQADFDTLIELIQTTVEPDSWEELGGEGAIDGFQGNLSLVVSQTQDVHEQIADLLEQLRRLQDLQVTIEVRFIALNDDFFERIGVDFDFDIDDNTGLDSQVDIPLIDDDGPNVTIGLDSAGMPNVDLDIPFTQDSFGRAIPQFGGFDANSAATIGFAILSDIEAMFLIQAVQGDTRTNVLQAPKVTLFNGQTAAVQDQAARPFVTSVIPVVGDFAAAQQPVITVLAEGTSLNVRAVVSQDRRFVRLDLVPFFSEIQDVDTFTFDGRLDSNSGTIAVDPTDDTATVVNNAVASNVGTTVQLPTLAFTTVNTTVSVPDGGTILLGGIKRLREGRTEQGVPMLSKVPYINRLFTNVGIGRETQSLMMMVTPRIIIHEEEEAKLLGTQP